MKALWVVGAPGVGKTTILRNYLDSFDTEFVPKPKWTLTAEFAMVGHYLGKDFDGGDTVAYNGCTDALNFWKKQILPDERYRYTIFDGDRFSNRNCLDFILANEVRAMCVLLEATDEELKIRRKARGSNQNPTWMKGRATKATNFFNMFMPENRLQLASAGEPSQLANTIKSWLEN